MRRKLKTWLTGGLAAFAVFGFARSLAAGAEDQGADIALILSVDVSNSVDASRYKLQMEGIARALEDPGVLAAITSGSHGQILLTLVTWADHAAIGIPWQIIRSAADAREFAAAIRKLPQQAGEYTCVARMFGTVHDTVIPALPFQPTKIIVDVSGDGIDNCTDQDEVDAKRDAIANAGVRINGLPIIVRGENDLVGVGAYRAPGYGLRELKRGPETEATTLDLWYKAHVVAGPGSFELPANGFEDFGRAFRQKFVTEISSLP